MKTRLVESFVNPASDGARGAAPLVLAAVGQKGSAAAVSAGLKEGARSAGGPEAAEPATGLPQVPLWARPAVRWAGAGAAALLILAAVAMGVHGKGSAKTDAAVATPPLSTAADPAAPAGSAPSGNALRSAPKTGGRWQAAQAGCRAPAEWPGRSRACRGSGHQAGSRCSCKSPARTQAGGCEARARESNCTSAD